MIDSINTIAILLFLVCWGLIIRKVIIRRYAPVKTVKAKVVDKYKSEVVSRYPQTLGQGCYTVVFATKDEKLAFQVSEFSYGSYQLNETGTLKYKGTKLISFQ